MKNAVMALLMGFVLVFTSIAQECEFYYPQNEGAELVYKLFDKKGKITGTSTQKVIQYKATTTGAEATIHVISADDKGKNIAEGDLLVKCEAGVFYFDMKGFFPQQTLDAYKDMEMKMENENLEMPSKLSVGQTLKDGWIKITVSSQGFKIMTMEVYITERKVESKESMTTPAGTFDCYKMSQTVSSKAGVKVVSKSLEWMHPGVGMVKSENYSKDNELMSSMVLSEIKK